MAKAQVGDLIRYIGGDKLVHSNTVILGRIYEVCKVYEEGVGVSIRDGSEIYFLYNDEYEIHRKDGEEDDALAHYQSEVVGSEADRIVEQDAVNSPNHYTQGRFETIEIIEEITQGYSDGYVAYCVGNALKYLARAPFKHGEPTEDLAKAGAYINFALERLQTRK